MAEESIDNIGKWVSQYFDGYHQYMNKYYPEIYANFFNNIHPPQRIGGGVMIGQGARHTDEEYQEIMKITKEFHDKYPDLWDFPKEW